MKDTVTILWFTGLISQYNVYNADIINLQLNYNLLNKIFSKCKTTKYIAIITIMNESDKQDYFDLITRHDLQDKLMFMFINVNTDICTVLESCKYLGTVNYYIDYSKRRLIRLMQNNFDFPQLDLVHISQLLD